MSNLPSGIKVPSLCMLLRTLNNDKFSAKLEWYDSKQNLLYFVCCRFSRIFVLVVSSSFAVGIEQPESTAVSLNLCETAAR